MDDAETMEVLPSSAKVQANFNNGMINQYSNETVIRWNEFWSQHVDQQVGQPIEVKIYAMYALAIHDALNNLVPKYETYALDNSHVDVSGLNQKDLSFVADAAVSQAAHDMVVQLWPDAVPDADQLLSSILQNIPDSDLKERGIAIGKAAAAAMAEKRKNDPPLMFTSYVGSDEPGVFRIDWMPWLVANPPMWPHHAAFGVNLGGMEPFGIISGDQFRDGEGPYALSSPEYIADYNEVKALGCLDCPTRTAEQTEIGAFWIETPSSSMNRLARTLAKDRKFDGWETARLIGLVQMAAIDGMIAAFEGMYYYDFWRPITAIRSGNEDGVEATTGDPGWTAYGLVPPIPEYPSSHAYVISAVASVLQDYFHRDQLKFTLTSPYYLPEVERHYSSFSEMVEENAVSRIYIGYRFRHSVEVGKRQGYELGEYVFENNLRELKKV